MKTIFAQLRGIWLKGALLMAGILSSIDMTPGVERQITHSEQQRDLAILDGPFNHELDNNDNFSPDDRFLVFDTRTTEGGIGASRLIAKVEIDSGKITPLYQPSQPNPFGPGVGAVSYSHSRDEVLFIHGPFHPTDRESQYELYRRVGTIVAGDGSGTLQQADARDTKAPYTPGALRGGTHRHEFSGDGNWVGFTYNDAVVAAYGHSIDQNLNLRTIGVTQLGQPLHTPASSQFPNQAVGFSALVVVVVPNPQPGSDEISHAAGDSWVGRHGYLRKDGRRQLARAFIGTTRDRACQEVDELYIVDIPSDITQPGPLGPLEGTGRSYPMPPAGAVQRRLTYTASKPFPGCQGIVRTSQDGKQIAFLMHDNRGDWQVFLISPLGGKPRQATFLKGGVEPGMRWHPSGNSIVAVAGTRIVITHVQPGPQFGVSRILSDRAPAPFALVVSHDGKTLAYNRRLREGNREVTHIFIDQFSATKEPMETGSPDLKGSPDFKGSPKPDNKIVPITLGTMPNSSKFGEQIYFGGQPQEADFKTFANQGFKTVINLRTSAEMDQLPFDERAIVEAAGMKYVHVPIGGEPATPTQLQAAMTALAGAHHNRVLFHCASSDRVGYVWALYRAQQDGLSPEAAIQEGRKAGMRSPVLEQWARETLTRP
jgi:uncharacterized protein (TIGR01244 family)